MKKANESKNQNPEKIVPAPVKEVTKYFSDLPFDENENLDPIDDYWKRNRDEFPLLFELAMDILTIPATSAPIERVFSQASIAIGVRRVRLTGKNLEKEVMLKCNSCFI